MGGDAARRLVPAADDRQQRVEAGQLEEAVDFGRTVVRKEQQQRALALLVLREPFEQDADDRRVDEGRLGRDRPRAAPPRRAPQRGRTEPVARCMRRIRRAARSP